jgi:hypothetical protein
MKLAQSLSLISEFKPLALGSRMEQAEHADNEAANAGARGKSGQPDLVRAFQKRRY